MMRDDTIATLRDLERFKTEAEQASTDAEAAEGTLREAQDRLTKANACIHATSILMKASGWMDDKGNIKGTAKFHFNVAVDAVIQDLEREVPLASTMNYFIGNMRRHYEFAKDAFPEFEAHIEQAGKPPYESGKRGLIGWVNDTPMPGEAQNMRRLMQGVNSIPQPRSRP